MPEIQAKILEIADKRIKAGFLKTKAAENQKSIFRF